MSERLDPTGPDRPPPEHGLAHIWHTGSSQFPRMCRAGIGVQVLSDDREPLRACINGNSKAGIEICC